MGNRAVITFSSAPETGIYLHWHGSPDQVQGFLDEAKKRGYRTPADDPPYALAGLVKVIQDMIDYDGLSVGIGPTDQLDSDNGDNGLYIVGPDWSLARREHVPE